MTQLFTGTGLGLTGSSLGQLGCYGPKGAAGLGQGGSSVYVNAATGNVVLKQSDGFLADFAGGFDLFQTYNSRGDGAWTFNTETRLIFDEQKSSIYRIDPDGHQSCFIYDQQQNAYLAVDGSISRLTFDGSSWIYREGTGKTACYYNQDGQITEMRDHDAHVFHFSYDNGKLTRITNSNGKQSIIWSFQEDRIRDVTFQSDGQTVHHFHYDYDAQNRLSRVSRDLGDGTTYWIAYDYAGDSHLISDIRQSDGTTLHLDYDIEGRIKRLVDGEGRMSTYDYLSGKTIVTNGLGECWIYEYDANARLIGIEGPDNFHATYHYDGTHLDSIIQGNQHWQFAYNDAGDCVRLESPTGYVTQRTYDSEHRLLSETHYQTFDGNHHPEKPLSSNFVYDEQGHLRFEISESGVVTEYRYDQNGSCVSQRLYLQERWNSSIVSLDECIHWSLTHVLKAISLVDYQYDWRGCLIEEIHYTEVDAQGEGVLTSDAIRTYSRFDAAGRLVEKSNGSSTTHYFYDDLGRLTKTIDNQQHIQTIEYDDAHQRIITTDPNGLKTVNTYDKSGLLLSTQRITATHEYGTTKFRYDENQQLIAETDVEGKTGYLFYDKQGRLQGRVSSSGQVTEYVYDNDGHCIQTHEFQKRLNMNHLQEVSSNFLLIKPFTTNQDRISQVVYNEYNQIAYQINAEGAVIAYQYDAEGHVIAKTAYASRLKNYQPSQRLTMADVAIMSTNDDRTLTYYYDPEGRLQAEINGEGAAVAYQYDAQGHLIEQIRYKNKVTVLLSGDWNNDAPALDNDDDIHTYSFYNAAGLKIGFLDAEGYLTEYSYDARGLLTDTIAYYSKIKFTLEKTTLATIRPSTHASDRHTLARYNDLNQLVEEKTYNGLVITYSYDLQGNVINKTCTDGKTHEARSQQYRYDALGRITQSLDAMGVAYLAQNNQLSLSEIDVIWQQHGLRYNYDLAGRLVSKINALNEINHYIYNDEGLLAYSVSAAGAVTENHYNAFQQLETIIRYSAYYSGKTATAQQLAQHIETLADARFDEVTHYEYNTLGLLLRSQTGSGVQQITTYNVFGERSEMAQRTSNRPDVLTDYQYNRQGLLLRRTEGVGEINKTFELSYDNFGRVEKEWDGRFNAKTFELNKRGEQITIENQNHEKKDVWYDAFGRVTRVLDKVRISYLYDSQNNTLTLKREEIGSKITTHFNAFGDKLAITDGNQQTTTYQYDVLGQLIHVEAPEHSTIDYTYDEVGHLIFQENAAGQVYRFTYDAEGHVLTQTIDPDGLAITTTYAYDALGRQLEVVDAGRCMQFTYDNQSKLVQKCQDPDGLHLLTTFSYNELGQLVREVRSNLQGVDGVTVYTRDALGRCLSMTVDPDGLRLTTSYTYDNNDNVITKTDANQNTTHYVYDSNNRVRYSIDACGIVTEHCYGFHGSELQTTIYAHRITASTCYDEATLSSMIQPNPDDQHQFFAYDRQSRLVSSYDGLGYLTKYDYDANDNLIAKKCYATPCSLSELKAGERPTPQDITHLRITRFAYDGLNRQCFRIDFNGRLIESRYDVSGQLIQRVCFANPLSQSDFSVSSIQAHIKLNPQRDQRTSYDYDKAGRLTAQASAAGVITTYEYDTAGNQIASCQHATRLNQAQLEDANWPSLLEPHLDDRITRAVYDAAGRECLRISPSGRTVERRYDAVGNVIAEITHAVNDEHMTYFEYDAAGRLLNQTNAAAETTRYTYDNNNNVTSKTDTNQNSFRYRYNAINQLIETAAPITTFSSYTNGAWHEETRSVITQNDYDSFGNVITVIRDVGGLNQTTQYTFDANNRILQTIYSNIAINNAGQTASSNRQEQNQTLTEESIYNAFGEVIEKRDKAGHSRHFAYNDLGQQVYALDSEGGVTYYQYDMFDNLSNKTTFALRITDLDNYDSHTIYLALGTDAHDRHEFYLYDKDHRLIETRKDIMRMYNSHTKDYQQLCPTTRYTYNAFGDVITQAVQLTDTDWSITTNDYDLDGLKTSTVDAEHYLTTYAYNAWGLLIEEIQYATQKGDGVPSASSKDRKVTFLYDVKGQLIQKTLKQVSVQRLIGKGTQIETITRDLTSLYTYDALGHLSSTTDPEGNTAYSYYNAAGQLSAKVGMVTQAGRAATTYRYDALGQLVESHQWARGAVTADANQFSLNNASDSDVILNDSYDQGGHLTQQIDGNGHAVYYSYDANGNLARSWHVLSQANQSTLTSDKRYQYDQNNQLIQTTTLKASGAQTTEDAKYNAFGEMTKKGLNGVLSTAIDYDKAGRIWRSNTQGYFQIYVYDLSNHITQVVTSTNVFGAEYAENGVDLSKERYETAIRYDTTSRYDLQRQDNVYDALGHLVGQSQEASINQSDKDHHQIYQSSTQTQDVDRWGNLLRHTNALGYTTYYEYNAMDACVMQKLPEVSAVDEKGVAHTLAPIIRYAVDALGRTIAMTDANNHTVAHVFDAEGRTIQDIDAKGAHRDKDYNLLGQMTRLTNELGGITTYTYDHMNRLLSLSTPKTATHYEYDEAGQLIRQTDATGSVQTMTYDELGHLITLSDSNGTTRYEYDDTGHKTAETDALGHTSTWRYDENGRLREHTDLGGHQTQYTYNINGLILSEKSTAGKDIVYHYYSNGQLEQYVDNPTLEVVNYAYDVEGNITSKTSSRVGDWAVETDHYQYDALGRLVQVKRRSDQDQNPDHAILSIDYDYDAVGNIRDSRVTAKYIGYQASSHTDYFRYDENNRMEINKGSLTNGQIGITTAQGSALSYDAAGHINDAQKYENGILAHYTYHYNTDNQLEIIRKNDHDLQTKRYVDGQVVEETLFDNQGTATQHNTLLYEKGRLLGQTTKNQFDREAAKTRYQYDAIGNMTQLTTDVTAEGKNPGYTQTHLYTYALWDSYLQQTDDLTIASSGYATSYGKSTHTYDRNGQVQDVTDQQPGTNNNTTHYLASSIDGVRARKDSKGQTSYLNVAGKTIGDLRLSDKDNTQQLEVYGGFTPKGGAQKSAPGSGFIGQENQQTQTTNEFLYDTEQTNTDATLPNAPQDNLGAYTIKAGDTLESIAFQIYGDSSLWYLIADANGITDRSARAGEKGSQLHIGLRLNLPQAANGQHHTNGTHKVLSSQDFLGNTSATLGTNNAPPPTKSPHHHNNFWKTMAKITTVIIGAVAMVMSAGLLATLLIPGTAAFGISSLITGGLSALGGTSALGLTSTLGVSFAAGFIGSIAGQGAANAMHLQKGIDLNGALLSGLATAATAGLGKLLNGSTVYKSLRNTMDEGKLNKVFSISNASEMMERDALTQSLNLALSHHQHFDWLELGVSTASAGIMGGEKIKDLNAALNQKIGSTSEIITSEALALATGGITNSHYDIQQILTDNLGSAVASGLFKAGTTAEEKAQAKYCAIPDEEYAYSEIPEGTYERFHEEEAQHRLAEKQANTSAAWNSLADDFLSYGSDLFGGWMNSTAVPSLDMKLVGSTLGVAGEVAYGDRLSEGQGALALRPEEVYSNIQISTSGTKKTTQTNNFDLTDAKNGLRKVYDQYGAEISKTVEKMYRLETTHFKSEQYRLTGTPGMEAPRGAKGPYYGWAPDFFEAYPEYTPIGTTGLHDAKGMSDIGGNKQKKGTVQFVQFSSVEAGMLHLAYRIKNVYHGDYAQWNSKTNPIAQQRYRDGLKHVSWDITKQLMKE